MKSGNLVRLSLLGHKEYLFSFHLNQAEIFPVFCRMMFNRILDMDKRQDSINKVPKLKHKMVGQILKHPILSLQAI